MSTATIAKVHHTTPISKIRTSINEDDDSLVSYTDDDSDSTSPDVYNSNSSNNSINSKRTKTNSTTATTSTTCIHHDNLSNYSHLSTPRILQNLGNCDELNILINKTPQTPSISRSPIVNRTPRSKTFSNSPTLSEDEDDIENELKLRINRNQEEDSVEFNDMLLEENSSAVRRAYAEAADEESSENENVDVMEGSGSNSQDEESDLTFSMSKTFDSPSEEASFFKRKYLETYRDLEVVSENYVKYQKSSEELEREYDAEIERYELMVQQQDTKILLLREEVDTLKRTLKESEVNHSEEVDKLIEELKDSNNSEKITLDLIKDMETVNGELEDKVFHLEEDAKVKEKKHNQNVTDLEKIVDELKHVSQEALEKVKRENEKLENDLNHLRGAVETGHQHKREMGKLTSELDDLKRQLYEKDQILKKYEEASRRKKQAAQKLMNGYTPSKLDGHTIDSVLKSVKLLSEGLSECQNRSSRLVSEIV